ncbi:MAG: hypothetical protein FWG11_02070 [Promicromonosporaceae bacterium]|nr:hypothetical protein [Promicromonosporaceae bacterium]
MSWRDRLSARRNVRFAIAVAVGLILTGCGGEDPYSGAGPWAHEFRRIEESATNDLVRNIVSNGELTLADMREAAARTNECFASVGSPASIIEDQRGGFQNVIPSAEDGSSGYPSEAVRRASIDCELDYRNDLWILWDRIRVNPDGVDFEYDPGNPMSDAEWEALWLAHGEATRGCRPRLPGGVYLDEGIALDCRMDPLNH